MFSFFFSVLILLQAWSAAGEKTTIVRTNYDVTLTNGYVSLTVNIAGGAWISELYGDFSGGSAFNSNLLAEGGIRLERETTRGDTISNAGLGDRAVVDIVQEDDACAIISIPNVLDASPAFAQEAWTISLCTDDRAFVLETTGSTLLQGEGRRSHDSLRVIRHSVTSKLVSTTGFFEAGVVQVMSAPTPDNSFFGSTDKWLRTYLLGTDENNDDTRGCIDIVDESDCAASTSNEHTLVMLNSDNLKTLPFRSGLHGILVGSVSSRDYWSSGYSSADNTNLPEETQTWSRKWRISANDRNFPAATLPSGSVVNMADPDIEGFMTGIYANAVPCLCTYPNEVSNGEHVAQIATTLRYQDYRGYNHTYSYFDPDNYFGVSAILFSGDAYLQDQARRVIERNGDFLNTETGQAMHHFEGVVPQYTALSGEKQSGPNIFWTKTALQYAAVTGDLDWLGGYMKTLRLSSSFVFDLIEEDSNLLLAPGSLMIDVFIRSNYTADSNSMVVGFLKDFAQAERLMGNSTRADELEAQAERVSGAVNEQLWAGEDAGADHFITQLNPDGTTRDFVDYDANLIAVANGVSDEARSRLIQKRVDSGPCSGASGAGAQWVSEVYYGPDDTTDGNVGDSNCSMARIGWFDALGRKRLGSRDDLEYFENRILLPLQSDVLQYTWLHERYGCDGLQQDWRTMYYFEYPSFVAMLTREMRYGVSLQLNSVEVAPFTSTAAAQGYEYHIGNVDVVYAPSGVTSISAPGFSGKLSQYRVSGLTPGGIFSVNSNNQECSVDQWEGISGIIASENGVLEFKAPRGMLPCVISIQY